jgi:hypothetical protein
MKAANEPPNESSETNFSETIHDLTSARNAVRQAENSDGDMDDQGAGTLLRRLSDGPRRELEDLVGKLMTLLKKLEADGIRIQLDIEEYTEMNQRVMQLTTIVADSVGKLPAPHAD